MPFRPVLLQGQRSGIDQQGIRIGTAGDGRDLPTGGGAFLERLLQPAIGAAHLEDPRGRRFDHLWPVRRVVHRQVDVGRVPHRKAAGDHRRQRATPAIIQDSQRPVRREPVDLGVPRR